MEQSYYIAQVITGKEKSIADSINKRDLDNVHAIFLQRRMNIRRGGKSLQELKPLFTGYIFIISSAALTVEQILDIRKIPGVVHFLPNNENVRILTGNDKEIIQQFVNFGEISEPSLAYFDKNDKIVIVEGPMKGLEGLIVSVDRRKRRVKLLIKMFQREINVQLSYDLIGKAN